MWLAMWMETQIIAEVIYSMILEFLSPTCVVQLRRVISGMRYFLVFLRDCSQLQTILRCPEYRLRQESSTARCCSRLTLCKKCFLSMRNICDEVSLNKRGVVMPHAALANDLMVFGVPSILYKNKPTIMELICVNVCHPIMISVTLEKKHRKKEDRLSEQAVSMQRHTIGMRGSVISFSMPWLEILRIVKEVDELLKDEVQFDLFNSREGLFRWV